MAPMPHTVTWQTPTTGTDRDQAVTLKNYTTQMDIPAFVQPLAAADITFYMQRGIEVNLQVFTTSQQNFDRNDRLLFNGRELYVYGPRDMCSLGRVMEILCYEYSSPAKKR